MFVTYVHGHSQQIMCNNERGKPKIMRAKEMGYWEPDTAFSHFLQCLELTICIDLSRYALAMPEAAFRTLAIQTIKTHKII